MPYRTEHSCRLKDPGGFQEGSFRRKKSGDLVVIVGRPHGKTTTTRQAFRYPISNWTAERARAHCKKTGGKFHAAQPKGGGKWHETDEIVLDEEVKAMAEEISLDAVRSAFYDMMKPPKQMETSGRDFYVKDVYTDHLIVETSGKLYRVPYSMGDEGIEFGEMQEVRIEYVPVKALRALFGRLLDVFRPAEGEKAKWTRAYINNLPDSAFLHIEAGGKKDEDGKTVPRTLRHLPVKDAEGKFDIGHVSNAISRAPQVKDKNGNKMSDAWVSRMQSKARAILKRLRKKMPEGFSGFKTYAQEDGRLRWLSWTTNAFRDREEEIFTTKALEDYAVRAMTERQEKVALIISEDEAKKAIIGGPLWIGHYPIKVGTADAHIVFGRFLVESGLFDESDYGQKAEHFFASYEGPLEMSHGYQYVEEDRADKVYEWLNILERSVLPAGAAANLWTSMATIVEEVKAMGMPPQVVQMVKDALGEEVFEKTKGDTEALTKALEAAGIDFKSLEGFEPPEEQEPGDEKNKHEETPTSDTAKVGEVNAAFAKVEADIKALEEKVDSLSGVEKALAELTEKVDALSRSDAEKIAVKVKEETPRGVSYRASQDPATVLTKEEEQKVDGPKVPKVVIEMAEAIAGRSAT